MRVLASLLFVLTLLISFGCVGQAGEITANLGQDVELKIGQTASIEGEQFRVKFVEVVNDSRCPEGATCIWQGEVSCIVEITYFESVHRMTLTQPGLTQESSKDLFKEYSITFKVRPYPKLGRDIKTNEYRLQLVIEKNANFEDIKWLLKSYGNRDNLKDIIAGTEITATFNSSNSQVSGSAGCNIYGGSYQIGDNALSIYDIYSTEMACIEPGVMEQEQEFLTILISAQSFQVDNDTLTILGLSGQQLYFKMAN